MPFNGAQPPRRTNKRRLFFAFWPDGLLRAAMADATRSPATASGGRLVPPENLHVTLVFLGSVEEGRLEELYALSAEVAAGFALTAAERALRFDILECWRRSRLLVAGVSDLSAPGAVGAERLVRELEASLRRIGLGPDPDSEGRRFRPHVTVARDVSHFTGARPLDPIEWRFAEFVLVDSKTAAQGSVYSVLRSFPLGLASG